ncbi:type IV pilin [Natrinema sp. H-ect4]|uniref:type IV pilin n=1 Tax=Natrinema sp. H-ect4 TaxID=3242699 RepID=UPI0035A8DCEE
MDGKSIRNKLIGSDDERAVSPVIGVILMVAITVILAAVIAAFVLDMGGNQEEPVNAAVDTEVTDADKEVQFTVTDMGNAESFVVRGPSSEMTGDEIQLSGLDGTGDTVTVAGDSSNTTSGISNNFESDAEGDFTVVGVSGDSETTVANFEIDFS